MKDISKNESKNVAANPAAQSDDTDFVTTGGEHTSVGAIEDLVKKFGSVENGETYLKNRPSFMVKIVLLRN